MLDEANEDLEIEELNELVDDLVEGDIDTLDEDFNVVEPDKVEDEESCELDFVPD